MQTVSAASARCEQQQTPGGKEEVGRVLSADVVGAADGKLLCWMRGEVRLKDRW